jgi:hypothetical protein
VADTAPAIAVEILKAARRWAQVRVVLRRTLDSKKATPQQTEKAKRDHHLASDELEALVMQLEKHLLATGKSFSTKRGPASAAAFPWREMFGMVAAGAKAVETALGAPAGVDPRKIIDMRTDK